MLYPLSKPKVHVPVKLEFYEGRLVFSAKEIAEFANTTEENIFYHVFKGTIEPIFVDAANGYPLFTHETYEDMYSGKVKVEDLRN